MLTKPIAQSLYTNLASASKEWFQTDEGKFLCEKEIALVREKEGDEEAEILKNLLTVAAAI